MSNIMSASIIAFSAKYTFLLVNAYFMCPASSNYICFQYRALMDTLIAVVTAVYIGIDKPLVITFDICHNDFVLLYIRK